MSEFWENKTLLGLSADQWELLCDGCGLCCLEKIQDEEDHEVFYTKVACTLLDPATCRCKKYGKRGIHVPECLILNAMDPSCFAWLPVTCAYRLLHEGKLLPSWHHLVCGDKETVHLSGLSAVRKPVRDLGEYSELEDLVICSAAEEMTGEKLDEIVVQNHGLTFQNWLDKQNR